MALNNIIFNDMFHVHIMITDVMCNVHWHYQTDLSLLSNVVCWYAYFLLSYKYELIVKLQTQSEGLGVDFTFAMEQESHPNFQDGMVLEQRSEIW